jgi:hypothetical protein
LSIRKQPGLSVAGAQSPADAQIVYLQNDEVAAPQFALDSQVGHREVARARPLATNGYITGQTPSTPTVVGT